MDDRKEKTPPNVGDRLAELTAGVLGRDDIQTVYTSWAGTYEKDITEHYTFNAPRQIAEYTASFFGDDKAIRILDCAAGTGLVGAEMTKKLFQLTKVGFTNIDAIDGNREMLQKAEEKGIYKNLICDFVGKEKLDILDDTYDAIVSTGSIARGHMDENCFEELIRITKPGGYIFLLMKEDHLHDPKKLKDTFEQKMQNLHDCNSWRLVKREVLPNYTCNDNGVVFNLQVV